MKSIEKKEEYSKQIIIKRKQKHSIIIPILDKIEFKKNYRQNIKS